MSKLKLFLAIVAVGIGVALTYHVFENVVHAAIDLIWYDLFDTDNNRFAVVPLAVVLALAFFGVQHLLDRKSENNAEHGLGGMPEPTATNYAKILIIGFLSLIAGASLGPEAVLVPACMVFGAFVGIHLYNDKQATKLLAAAGIMALFTAFFHSFIVGILSLALVRKQAKVGLNPTLLLTAVVASLSAYVTLSVISGEPFLSLSHYDWSLNWQTLAASVALVATGYVVVIGMSYMDVGLKKITKLVQGKAWWQHALLAATVLSALYLLGGPLVEFTGNNAINPMFADATGLGLLGLLWLLIIKMAAISWSKTTGYRGGLIFPTIFLAAVLVAIVQLQLKDFNMIYGMVAVLIGAFAANSKTHTLV